MTKTEVTELFSIMMLAWPQARMFQPETLRQTVELWAASTQDIDFETAKRAALTLCQRLKFPPSIAEFREAAEAVRETDRARMLEREYEDRMLAFLEGQQGLPTGRRIAIEGRKETT